MANLLVPCEEIKETNTHQGLDQLARLRPVLPLREPSTAERRIVTADGPPHQNRDGTFVSTAWLIRNLYRSAYRQSRLLFPLPCRGTGQQF